MKILGYDYKLLYSPTKELGGTENSGQMNPGSQVIFISPEQHKQAQESTVIHEILEAIKFHCQINITHEELSTLEAVLYQVLRDTGMDTSFLLKELKTKKTNAD